MKRLVVLSMVVVLIAGCGGDDELTAEQRAAQEYVLAVERVIDAVHEDGTRAVTTLNRLASEKLDPADGAATLDEIAKSVRAGAAELDELTPPEPASAPGGDLAGRTDDLAFDLESAAGEIRAADRGILSLGDTARSDAELILGKSSSLLSLSLAVRALALESVDFPVG